MQLYFRVSVTIGKHTETRQRKRDLRLFLRL
nr:MAG TPA: hypothetical protein [Caudoviricetes sp.]DAI72624.1 MAG TPA: hypothetical protein [Caudoviricetes sp.]